nr:hypothetical protein [Tanacetum cinerariifolium]
MSRYYTLDEETYPRVFHNDRTEIDLPVFIHVVDPTKVRIVKKEHADGEVKLWDYAVGRVIPILSVAPPKKPQGDYGTSSKVVIGGKSPFL